jgi:hypothetical protein
MSYWVAGAMVVGAVGSYASSENASKAVQKSAKNGLADANAKQDAARADAINLFGQGRSSAQAGIGGAMNFYKQNAQASTQPLIQGNMMAQQALGQGGIQANNAILGLPVDMSFANNPQQVKADYTNINNAQLPQLGASFADTEAARAAAAQPGINAANAAEAKRLQAAAAAKKRSLYDGSNGGITMAAFDKDRLKLDNIIGNPLGIAPDKFDKVNPMKVGKKLIKKIF